MKCLLWRQHRWQLLWSAVVIAAIGAAMAAVVRSANNWLASYHRWLGRLHATGCQLPGEVPRDQNLPSVSAACRALSRPYSHGAQTAFVDKYNFAIVAFEEGLPLLLVLMAVLVGAPLVAREIEQRTQLVAWTQSVSRRAWYLSKVTVVGGALFVLALIAGIANDQLQQPLTEGGLTTTRWPWFFSIDITPAAEAVLAFALAVALGAWLGRTLAAVGAALVCFLVLFVATNWAIRSLTPARTSTGERGTPDSGWIIDGGRYHPAGQYWQLQVIYAIALLALVAAILAVGWRAVRARAV
jgi:hypothetical protein